MDTGDRLAGTADERGPAGVAADRGVGGDDTQPLDTATTPDAPFGVEFNFRLTTKNGYLCKEGQDAYPAADSIAVAYSSQHDPTGEMLAEEMVGRWNTLAAVTQERDNLRAALIALREWHKGEYQSNPIIDAQADKAIGQARDMLGPQETTGK